MTEEALAAGARVFATARTPDRLKDLEEQYPETLRTARLDVTDEQQIRDAVEAAVAVFERLDVVVNNAGYALIGALEEISEPELRRNLDTNFIGPLNVMRAALPVLRRQKHGHIVNISAIAASSNEMGFSIYGGAKAALEAATEAVDAEVSPLGIRATLVIPGPFRTEFIGKSLRRAANHMPDYDRSSGKFAAYLERINGKQPGDPFKAAQAILRMTEAERPPRRLFLGAYAHDRMRKKLDQLRVELEHWQPVGLPVDFQAPQTAAK